MMTTSGGLYEMSVKQKFATQVDPDILAKARAIATSEGRQFQSIIEEALSDLIEKRVGTKPRPHVLAQYQASVDRNSELYERLAK
jgi:hypothetical protein